MLLEQLFNELFWLAVFPRIYSVQFGLIVLLNHPVYATGLFLYPLETKKRLWFSVF